MAGHQDGATFVPTLAVMDAKNLAFPDSFFDAVVAQYVITAVPDPEATLDDFVRVLKPGAAPVSGPVRIMDRHPAEISVKRVHQLLLSMEHDRGELEAVAAVEELAASWRDGLLAELAKG